MMLRAGLKSISKWILNNLDKDILGIYIVNYNNQVFYIG